MSDICKQIYDELNKSNKKHRNYFASTHEAYAVIKEEFEELYDALNNFWEFVKKDDLVNCKKEALQMGAMIIKFLETFDEVDQLEF